MKESYELKDIISTFFGCVDAVGDSNVDEKTLQNLELGLPQLFKSVINVFYNMPYELLRNEASVFAIGQIKSEWAMKFKEVFDCAVACTARDSSFKLSNDDETTVS